jgi:predicted AlkP superfamily phosphohydrolase/phosphomutase
MGTAGVFGELRSCHPPITVPAWRVMASGHSAGRHGVYGFQNRVGNGYDDFALTVSSDFKGSMVWDRLAAEGLRTTLIGLPGTYPPSRLAGKMISGPLTPEDATCFTWPHTLGERVRKLAPDYAFDARDFRHMPADALVEGVTQMTRARFAVARALAGDDDWNLLWHVEIGLDRLHHALWHTLGQGEEAAGPLRDYYRLLDRELGELVQVCDDGDTAFAVVSDHGARSMVGGICVNRWLEQEGYLTLAPGIGPGPFRSEAVDWRRTRAWATGGYLARIFFNVQGREPHGVVPPGDVDALAVELAEKIRHIPGPAGEPLEHAPARPADLYDACNGHPPDLVATLGDLDFRAVDAIGPGPIHVADNDRGPDSANHDWMGIYLASGAGISQVGRGGIAALEDVAAFVERLLLGG